MELTIEVPEKVVARAAELDIPVETLVSRALEQIVVEPAPPGFVRFGIPKSTGEEAGAIIREIASRHTLGGLNLKELIHEVRRN